MLPKNIELQVIEFTYVLYWQLFLPLLAFAVNVQKTISKMLGI